MAVDMFLVIDGPKIKGETQDDAYKGEGGLDVLAWSWGVSNSGSTHFGGGSGAGKASFQDMSVTTWYDAATHELIKSSATGTHHSSIRLVCRKAGKKPLEYIDITMKDCLISSVSTGGSGGEDRLTINFSINFGAVDMLYKVQNKAGGEAAQVEFKFDIAANKEG